MSITVAFLGECQGSATIDVQKRCVGPDDHVVIAGREGFNKLGTLLRRHSVHLNPGDRVKVYNLASIAVSTTTLIRVLTKMLRKGITFETYSAGIVIEPRSDDRLYALLEALNGHYRHLHGIKTHPADTARQGRRRLLDPDQLPDIRAKLGRPGATATDVARELGVARSTLFNYLERFGRDRRLIRGQELDKRPAEHIGDDAHVPKSKANQTSA